MNIPSFLKASYLVARTLMKPSNIYRYYEPIERYESDVSVYERLKYVFSSPIEIFPNLFLGNSINAANKELLKSNNFDIIINVTDNIPNFFENDFEYYNVSIKDNTNAFFGLNLENCAKYIHDNLRLNKKIIVHCFEGRSRSVTIIIYYLMNYHNYKFIDIYNQIKNQKNIVNINKSFVNELCVVRQRSKSLNYLRTTKNKIKKTNSLDDLDKYFENYVVVEKFDQ